MQQLLPQDVVVVLKLAAGKFQPWSYARLGEELDMSASQVFASVARAEASHLLDAFNVQSSPTRRGRGVLPEPNVSNLKEFLIYGAKYAFPVRRGGPTRGMVTAEAAPPLSQHFPKAFPLPPVWPFADGRARGIEFSPLYKNVPLSASKDRKLYELLALLDAIREGRTRERDLAVRELVRRLTEVVDPSSR